LKGNKSYMKQMGGWYNGIYYTFFDGIVWFNSYAVKQNWWKSKRRRKENLKKVESLSGEVVICKKCDGYGFPKENLLYSWCEHCSGSGLIDWISRIR